MCNEITNSNLSQIRNQNYISSPNPFPEIPKLKIFSLFLPENLLICGTTRRILQFHPNEAILRGNKKEILK